MKITLQSKPEEMTSKKGTKYFKVKITDEKGEEKSGSLFGCNTAPQIDDVLEVEEKYNEEYKSFSWFTAQPKKAGFTPKPSMTVDQQIRAAALSNATNLYKEGMSSVDIMKFAVHFETYIREGKA